MTPLSDLMRSGARAIATRSASLFVLALLVLASSYPAARADTLPVKEAAGLKRAVGVAPAGWLAPDTKWKTPYYIIDSGKEGPTVLITGGLHGNEPAGYRAAEQIRHWPIVAGKLIVVPRTNTHGLAANSRFLPGVPKGIRDLNRNFPKAGTADATAAHSVIGRAMWLLARKHRPDWAIDLHEGYEFNISHKAPNGAKKSVGSSVIYRSTKSLDPLVARMLGRVNQTIADADRKFVPLKRGPVDGSLARACMTHLGARAMILETTYSKQPISTRTRQHRMMVSELLQHLKVIDKDCVDILTSSRRGKQIAVAMFDGGGTGPSGHTSLPGIIDPAADMQFHHIGSADIRGDVLRQFDAVIFPGGSGSKQAAAIGESGRTNVKRYIHNGGGYLGICAGAFLCSAHYSWSLDLVDASVFTGAREIPGKGKKQMWYRGKRSMQTIEFTKQGKAIFGDVPMKVKVMYHNGPIISPKGDVNLKPFVPLAYFRSEKVLHPPQKGTMINTPAIVVTEFGEGRVMSISPHPEATDGLRSMIPNAIRWVVKREAGRPK